MSRIALAVETLPPTLQAPIRLAQWGAVAGLTTVDLNQADFNLAFGGSAILDDSTARPMLLSTFELSPAAASLAGVTMVGRTPFHQIRIRQTVGEIKTLTHADPQATLLFADSPTLLKPDSDDVLTFGSFAIGLDNYPAFTFRPSTGVALTALGNDPTIWQNRDFLRLIHKFAHQVSQSGPTEVIRVGLLGFGAIGDEHSSRIAAVEGIGVTAICDTSADRLTAAMASNPTAQATQDADELLKSDVDLIIVSTPPNSHAKWGLRALDAGKHVVLEKPMALTMAECDLMLNQAVAKDLLLSVYQNRRWDADFLTIEKAISGGRIGEVFRIETFVGGFSHPCNFWHSDQDVSGGAIFDWGSHLIDQILQIAPAQVASVNATNLKRVWHDVTNADHSIVNLTFTNGTTGEFTHSDISAALKPRWYILGTQGALVGNWRTERVISRSPIGTLDEDVLSPADSPAQVNLYDPDGSVTTLKPTTDAGQVSGGYHQELVDYLHLGLPMTIKPKQSRDVIAIMQAAEESAKAGGISIIPDL